MNPFLEEAVPVSAWITCSIAGGCLRVFRFDAAAGGVAANIQQPTRNTQFPSGGYVHGRRTEQAFPFSIRIDNSAHRITFVRYAVTSVVYCRQGTDLQQWSSGDLSIRPPQTAKARHIRDKARDVLRTQRSTSGYYKISMLNRPCPRSVQTAWVCTPHRPGRGRGSLSAPGRD